MRISRDEQLALVGEHKHSGLSATAFCRERGICYQSFLNWKKKAASPDRITTGRAAFVELSVEPEAPKATVSPLLAELVLGGGMVLKVFAPSPDHR